MTDKIKSQKNSGDQVCTGGSDRCLRGTVTDFHQRQYEELCCGREKSRGISGYEGYEKSRSAGLKRYYGSTVQIMKV